MIATALASAGCLSAALLYGIRGRSAQIFGRSVYRGAGRRRSIALTFDDGPSEGSLLLADVLEREGVRATFFLCGENLLRNPGIARQLQRRGHELGNHTFSHRHLSPRVGWKLNILPPSEVVREVKSAQETIRAETGISPQLFRAPYGRRWFGLGRAQRELGLLGVTWTVIGHDWEWESSRIVDHVMQGLRPGGIVCLHDGRATLPCPDISNTVAAVKILIPRIKARGFSFETVSELLAP